MRERQDVLVRIDPTGAAHPVGRTASRELRNRQGGFRLLPSPGHVVAMAEVTSDDGPQDAFWMTGQITRAGMLWDLVAMIGQGNWCGQLHVETDDCKRTIYVDGGVIVGGSSNAERERLGEILYQYGALTKEQVQIVVDAISPHVRFGEAAVALGFLSNEKLFELISRQAEEILYATMMVSDGTFYFLEGFDESRLPYRLSLPVTSLLMEGVRRMDEMECFRAAIPSSLHVPSMIEDQFVDENHEHYHVWCQIDGSKSLDDIGRALGMGQFDVTRALFHLQRAHIITVGPPRPTGVDGIVALFNQAISTILSSVDRTESGKDVREQLASFATASGVYDALFRDAGPGPDGTVDGDKIAETIEILVGPVGAEAMLAQWLYEYASFAMFIAEPLLRADEDSDAAPVSKRVHELLAPLAPEG